MNQNLTRLTDLVVDDLALMRALAVAMRTDDGDNSPTLTITLTITLPRHAFEPAQQAF